MLLRIFFIIALACAIFGGAYIAVQTLYLQPHVNLKADADEPRPAPPKDPSLPDFQQCLEIQKAGAPADAVAAFERFLQVHPSSSKRDEARDRIGELNSSIFFNVKPTEENTVIAAPGDALARIASRAKMSMELIVHLNKLPNDKIQRGQRLIAFPTSFRLVLKQSQQRVILMNGDKFFRQYPTLAWPGKKPLPKQTVKVTEKAAFNEKGQPPKPTSQEYYGCFHTIGYPIHGHSIFSHADDPSRPIPNGIRLAPEHMSEIAVLLPKGAPVTLE